VDTSPSEVSTPLRMTIWQDDNMKTIQTGAAAQFATSRFVSPRTAL
jgi:hypothetical protein